LLNYLNRKESRTHNKRLAKKRFLWIIETLCNAFSFEVVEKIELRNPLIRQAPFVMCDFKKPTNIRNNNEI